MSAPESYTWYIKAVGDTDSRVFVWKDETGNPVNLTGYTVKLIVDHSAVLTMVTIPSGQIVAAEGRITATIDNSISEGFKVREGRFRIMVTDPSSEPRTVAFGPLVVASL